MHTGWSHRDKTNHKTNPLCRCCCRCLAIPTPPPEAKTNRPIRDGWSLSREKNKGKHRMGEMENKLFCVDFLLYDHTEVAVVGESTSYPRGETNSSSSSVWDGNTTQHTRTHSSSRLVLRSTAVEGCIFLRGETQELNPPTTWIPRDPRSAGPTEREMPDTTTHTYLWAPRNLRRVMIRKNTAPAAAHRPGACADATCCGEFNQFHSKLTTETDTTTTIERPGRLLCCLSSTYSVCLVSISLSVSQSMYVVCTPPVCLVSLRLSLSAPGTLSYASCYSGFISDFFLLSSLPKREIILSCRHTACTRTARTHRPPTEQYVPQLSPGLSACVAWCEP